MMFARRVHYTYEEYLRALEDSEIKLEYCEGEIFAMAGGTLTHAKLSARIAGILATVGEDLDRSYIARWFSLLDVPVWVASPEDTVVAKLEWSKQSGGSERQRRDAVSDARTHPD